MSKLIGIDLGTTNSCVAVMEGGEPTIIPNEHGGRTTPSVVAFTKDGQRLVGDAALRQAALNPERTIRSIKRDMGSTRKIKIDGQTFSPEQISAVILQKLKRDAEAYLGEPVHEAVITVPAYFSDAQRQATRDAGIIAGLNVQRIINEPTAAALAYGVDKQEAQKILVYDLGGGTFDVSVLDISNGVIEVLATAGNNRLGGDDFDRCLAEHLVSDLMQQTGVNVMKDASAEGRVMEAAQKAKVELSTATTAQISLPFLLTHRSKQLHLETTLTREKFNDLTKHLVNATKAPVQQALQDAGVKPAELAKVLLVGGSTRIPAVQEMLQAFTGKQPFRGINPDECVALGASLQGGVLAGGANKILLLDVTPMTLGIETLGGVFAPIIERNSTLPTAKSQIFTTVLPFQTTVDIKVYQGENQHVSGNRLLGSFRLNGVRPAPQGVPQIEVTFDIDVNGIVHVTARDLQTGKLQEISVSGNSNMNMLDMHRAIQDAQLYAAKDEQQKQLGAAQNRAEQLLYQAKYLSRQLPEQQQFALQAASQRLEQAMQQKDTAAADAACTDLQHLLNLLQQE